MPKQDQPTFPKPTPKPPFPDDSKFPIKMPPGMSRASFMPRGAEVTAFASTTTAGAVLRGGRVTLRALRPDDFEQWQGAQRRNAAPAADLDAEAFDGACAAIELAALLGLSYRFGIFLEGALVGEIALTVDGGSSGAVAVWVDETHEGTGLATESCVLVARHAFDDLGLHRFEAVVPVDAAGVRQSLEWAGLRDEGQLVEYARVDGEWRDHVLYAFTAEEFDQQRVRLLEAAGV
jgi:ribosomal-protein-alanine N-acetyltransferase